MSRVNSSWYRVESSLIYNKLDLTRKSTRNSTRDYVIIKSLTRINSNSTQLDINSSWLDSFRSFTGGSCDPPISAFEAILQDAKTFNKPLFIFQQDISKAFDSIDTNMLRLAMLRLKIPSRFVDLTIDLFSNRFNSIITTFGNTSPYKVQIGIDQGEVISPLLWVI